MSTPDRPCCFDHDRNGQPVQATQVIVVESRGQHYEYESCQGHATAARMRSDSFGSQGRGEDLAEVQGHIKDTASKITSRPIGREDRRCDLHDHARTQNADRYIFTITHPDGTVTQVVVCQEHREWINGQSRSPELRPPDHSDRKAVAELKPQLVDPKNRIAGGGRAPEQPDLGPGGGPGGRSMVPDLPAPPRKIERTYQPPSDPDGGRLVPGCFGLLETVGFPSSVPLTHPDANLVEGVLAPVEEVDLSLQILRVVVIGDGSGSVVEHPRSLGPGPRIAQIGPPIFGYFGPCRRDLLTCHNGPPGPGRSDRRRFAISGTPPPRPEGMWGSRA